MTLNPLTEQEIKGFCRWNPKCLSGGVKSLALLAVVAALALTAPPSAMADLVVFSDQASFLASTSAVEEEPIPNLGLVGSPVAVGNLTFSLGPGATQIYLGTGGSQQWSTKLEGNEIAISGFESLNVIDTATAITALGFDFHEPSVMGYPPSMPDVCNAVCVDSTFAVTLKMNGTVVGSFSFAAPNDVAAFVGVWNDTPFNRMEIRETIGGNDNEFYGQFYTSTIPEPSTWLLLATCAGLAAVIRRRK